MELRGPLAEWNGSRLSGAAKVPFSTRRMLAQCMGLPAQSIDMIDYEVGSGLAVRGEFYPEGFLVSFAVRQVSRPGKMD